MTDKLIYFVIAVLLLLLTANIIIIIFVPNILKSQICTQKDDDVLRNSSVNYADRETVRNRTAGFYSLIGPLILHRLEILVNKILSCANLFNDCYFNADRGDLHHYKYIDAQIHCNLTSNFSLQINKRKYKTTQSPSELLTFMIAVTFVKLIVFVIAYQQLLQNGYIIFQNLYNKQTKQVDSLICNRSYQVKSGHGLGDDDEDDDDNDKEKVVGSQYQVHHPKKNKNQQLQQEQIILSQINNIIEYILESNEYIESRKYSSIRKVQQQQQKPVSLGPIHKNSKNQNICHQHQKDRSYHQQFDCIISLYSKSQRRRRYHQYHYTHCFYRRDQRYCYGQLELEEKRTAKVHHHQYGETSMVYHKTYCDHMLASPVVLWQTFSATSSSLNSKKLRMTIYIIKLKISRIYKAYIKYVMTSQPTTLIILTMASSTSSSSPSSTISCWKKTGSHKHRKRKGSFVWNKYIKNYNYIIWKISCGYRCCCYDAALCNPFFRYCEGFRVYYYNCYTIPSCCCCCYYYYYYIFEIDAKSAAAAMAATGWNYSFHKHRQFNTHSKFNSILYNHKRNHQLNIIKLTKEINSSSTRQLQINWCIGEHASHYKDDERNLNLIRTLNAVKAITSAIQNRSYKTKLKNKLVWLFIGLVWLEGPKLINCSISHNNNSDITRISENETANKFSNNQNNNNNDNSSDNNNSGGGSGNDTRSKAESSNTNGPGESSRPNVSESKIQNLKSRNLLKMSRAFGKSESQNVNKYTKNNFKNNAITIGRPVQSKQQSQSQTLSPQDQRLDQKPYIVVRTGYKYDDQTNTRSTSPSSSSIFESEKANRVQSDVGRLESIKRQILTKLGLTEKPNVTHPLPKQFIWDTIYRANGIKSVSDFDFNDIHQSQEHIRLAAAAVLEPPPVIYNYYKPNINNVTDMEKMYIDRNRNRKISELSVSNSDKRNDALNDKNVLNISWKQPEKSIEYVKKPEDQVVSKYHRNHRQQTQQHQRSQKNKITKSQNRNVYDHEYSEGDDFFGSTQEIITFAEKGKIYKKHRLVEFSPPSNKIPKQNLLIRNAEIHIRIEKVVRYSSIEKHHHHPKFAFPKETNLKIWIFQLIGNDFSSKGFDQVATLCTSLSVDYNVLGWQKLDITKTVQLWYGKQPKEKLRLLIDCTGCGSLYILHLFDKEFHHSLLTPSTAIAALRRPYPAEMKKNKATINKYNNTSFMKTKSSNQTRSQQYYYHYSQHSHHRYRRKIRLLPKQHNIQNKKQVARVSMSPSIWLSSKRYRLSRDIRNLKTESNDTNQGELGGISYEVAGVGGEHYLEDRVNPNRPFLVLHTEPNRSRRVRRRAIDCSGAMHGQCCRESFYVSFKALGWDDWIIAPRGYFANYCRGDCIGPYRTPDTFQTFHAHFIEEYRKMGLLNGMQPCCAPIKFSSMSLIYYGDDGIIKRDLPKMVVDECGCP